MRTKLLLASVLALLLIAGPLACGDDSGESGLSGDKQISQLSLTEAQSLCEWVVDQQGGGGVTKSCPGDVSIHLVTLTDCVDHLQKYYKTCELTVEQAEACATVVGQDACTGFGKPECEPARVCSCGTSCPTAAAFP